MEQLQEALGRGNPHEVADLIARAEDARYRHEHGYNAALDAVRQEPNAEVFVLDLDRLAWRVSAAETSSSPRP